MSRELAQRMADCGVIPVVVIDDAADALPLARALSDGGIDAVEFTFRTPAAAKSIRTITSEMPDMLVGAGTILTLEQLREAKGAGAMFAVSPGLNPTIVRAAKDTELFFMPGVATPSEVEAGIELGCKELKLFPAEPLGGLAYLKSLAAPYKHLGIRYIPLGGVSTKNVADYLADPSVLACGGSWIAKRDRIADKDFDGIRQLAQEARQAVAQARAG